MLISEHDAEVVDMFLKQFGEDGTSVKASEVRKFLRSHYKQGAAPSIEEFKCILYNAAWITEFDGETLKIVRNALFYNPDLHKARH